MNRGMINLWRDSRVEFLVQVHDSLLFQCHWKEVNEVVPDALKALEVHLPLKRGRDFFLPLEAMTGYNWNYMDKETNPEGLSKFKGEELRKPPIRRTRKHSKLLKELF